MEPVRGNADEPQKNVPTGSIDAGRNDDVDVFGPEAVLTQQLLDDRLRRWKVGRDDLGAARCGVAVVATRQLCEAEPLLFSTLAGHDHRTRAIADDVVQDLARRSCGE